MNNLVWFRNINIISTYTFHFFLSIRTNHKLSTTMNPQSVFNANGDRYDNVATKIYPPVMDEMDDQGYDGQSGMFDELQSRSTNETMRFKGFFGNLDDVDENATIFAPRDMKGYSKTNINHGATRDGIEGISDIDDLDEYGDTGEKGGSRELNEEFDTRDIALTKNKNSKPRGPGVVRRSNNSSGWFQTADPFGGGRSYLLRELKEKFIHLTTPLTRFVTRYLALTGKGNEYSLHDLIKVRRVFDKAQPNNDWEGLVASLYGNGVDDDDGLDPTELSNAILHLVKENVKMASNRTRTNRTPPVHSDNYQPLSSIVEETTVDTTMDEVESLLRANINIKYQTAAMLKKSYENMISGKVVFLLDPILRETAQSVLDTINENFRGSHRKPNFHLLEIMKSNAVMTVFIRLMMMTQYNTTMLGTTPVSRVSPRTMYGSSWSDDDHGSNKRRSGGGGGKMTVFQNRPSVANMVAGSLEYTQGMEYFRHVEKARDGGGGLIYRNAMFLGKGNQMNGSVNDMNRRTDRQSTFIYNKKEGVYEKYKSTDHAESSSSFSSYNRSSKPIETIQSAIEKMKHDGQYFDPNFDDNVVSYIDKFGKMKLINRNMLNNSQALTSFYLTGSSGAYEVSFNKGD